MHIAACTERSPSHPGNSSIISFLKQRRVRWKNRTGLVCPASRTPRSTARTLTLFHVDTLNQSGINTRLIMAMAFTLRRSLFLIEKGIRSREVSKRFLSVQFGLRSGRRRL